MKEIYLVTGAAGFLGSHVCDQLLEEGKSVRALVLPNDKTAKFIPAEVRQVVGNLCDKASLEAFFSVPEDTQTYLIHCASLVTVDPEFSQRVMDVNVTGTDNIIELCLNHPECRKMVYVSSTGAIPEQPKGTKITETDHFTPVDGVRQVGCYSQSKAIATQHVLDAVRERGLNACVVFPSGIMGPKDFALGLTTKTLVQIMNGEMSGGMEGSFNLVDVRDLADGCIRALERGRSGEGYILANEELTFKDMCRMLHEDTGCKTPKFFLPLWVAGPLARMMERRAAKTGKKPLMTSFSVYNLARNNEYDYSKAVRELGFKTRPYADTIHDEARWIQEHGLLSA